MSNTNAVLFGTQCGSEIYSVDRATWIDCQEKAAKLAAGVTIGVLVVVLMVIFFVSDSTGFKIIATLVAFAIGSLLIVNAFYFAGKFAAADWDILSRDIEYEMNVNKRSRVDAIDTIRKNRLAKAQMEQQERIARSQNAAMITSAATIARSISRK